MHNCYILIKQSPNEFNLEWTGTRVDCIGEIAGTVSLYVMPHENKQAKRLLG